VAQSKTSTVPQQDQVAQARLQAIVHGRVQGVSFRYYTQLRARELGLTGYVRNLRDGSVQVVAEGPRLGTDQLLAFLHSGPPAAFVTRVETQWLQATGEFPRFEVRF
jgi:acylphosphatase